MPGTGGAGVPAGTTGIKSPIGPDLVGIVENLLMLAEEKSEMGFSPSLEKHPNRSQHIKTMYKDRPQNTTLLLPPTSAGFYLDGNSPREKRGK